MPRRLLAPFVLFCCLGSVAFALYAALLAPPDLEEVRELLIARRYAEAATAAGERLAAAEVPAEEAAELRFLLAHAKLLQGDREGGRAALEALIAAQPAASWSSKARFELADLERAQGRHEPAARLFRERVAALIAPERKGEVAAIYRRFATEALAKEPPDLARARAFYDLAAELGLPAAEELAVRFAAAEIAERQADWGAARERFAALREKHGDGEGGKLLYHLALAELRSGQASAARAHFEDLLRAHARSPQVPEALHGIAASYGFPLPPSEAALERGATFARRVIAEYPQHPLAAQSAFELGEAHFHVGRTAEAAAAWQAYVQSYATVDDARTGEARVKIGECAEREQRYDEAIAAWKVFLGAHPFHPRGTEILQRIASAELERAGVHARAKRWDEARAACEEWLARYPLDPRAQEVLGEIGALERAAKRFDAAIAQWERVAGKFPGTEAASLALYLIGETQELDLQQLERAVATYRRCSFGSSAGPAALRLRALEEQTLSLRTPRVYRSNEKVLVELATRNIEKLRVRIYALDLPSYFASKRGIGGVENLDIEIIQPTRTFDFAPALYAKHKEIASPLDLEVSGTGAWVVKVDDGRTEATVLALRSDLEILSRATKQDLVVYAEDVLAGRAAADVPIFVADGAKLLFEGRTDARGLFHRRDAKLREAAQLRIFATTSAGSAFSGLDLASLAVQGELQPKGYLLTDRGVYEPGEVVHAHAFVREVKDGQFAFESGVPWTLEWLGPEGALLASRVLPLGAAGSLQDRFELGAAAALGGYTLRVRRGENGPVFTQPFEVRRFERKALKLELEVEKAVLYRGEPVRGTAIARFFHGGPAAERRIAVLLSDGTQREGRTDAAGRFAFEFATTDLLEEQELALRATLLDEGVGATQRLRLAVNALELELATLRELYVAGESFDLELRARDPLGAPQKVAAELAIYRVVEEDGVRSERLEREEKLATDAKGQGRLALALRAGGSYRLRATALDRFGNRIHAKRELFISGEEDEVKLRLLSASDTLEAGVPSAVRVLSRLQPTRVLVTRLGDGIQSFEVRELARGEATWTLETTAADAPRFVLALAAIEGTKLHEAVKEFRVKRELAVTVEPLAAQSAPGAEARAKVRVRSPRPLAEAELVVAVVDEAYLALHPDGAPSIAEFFTGERALDSRAGSSCGFASTARARLVPQALLAEEQRRLELRERQSAVGDPQSGEPGGTLGALDLSRFGANRESAVAAKLLVERPELSFRMQTAAGLAGGGGGRPGRPPGSGAHEGDDSRAKLKDANGEPAKQSDEFYLGLVNLQKNRGDDGRAEGRTEPPNEPELRADFRATAWFGVVPLRAVEGGALEGELGFELPDSTTSWQWTARALDRDASGGEARATSIAKLPLEVRIDAPRSLVEGDRVRVRAQARNTGEEAQRLRASLRASGALSGEASAEPTLAAGGEHELALELEAQKIGSAELRSELRAATTGDAAVRVLEVRPNAVPTEVREAGVASDSVRLSLALDPALAAFDRTLHLELQRAGGEALLELALRGGSGGVFEARGCPPVDLLSRALVRASLALDALRWIERGGAAAPVAVERLRAEVASCVARLAAVQRADGGFDWIGVGGGARKGAREVASDAQLSSRAHAVLVRAQTLGFAGAAERAARSRAFLENALKSGLSETAQARALASLALDGSADFAALNRLLRRREALGGAGLGFVALACARQGREDLAREALALAQTLVQRDTRGALLPRGNASALESEELEASGALLAAAVQIAPRELLTDELARALEARRSGDAFGGDGATELAVHALFARASSSDASGDRFEVEVRVNEAAVGTWTVPSDRSALRLALPIAEGDAAPREIALRFQGVGRFRYAARLGGWTRTPEKASTGSRLGTVQRRVLAPLTRLEGRELPEGFGIVEQISNHWWNTTDEVVRASAVRVETSFRATAPGGTFVLEDPLPAGCEVEPGSIAGSFAHWEQAPGRLLFFFPPQQRDASVSYRLLGRFEGRYRHLPARVWSYVDPSWSVAGIGSELAVLASDEPRKGQYRPTPDELYQHGERLFARGDYAGAAEKLEPLLKEFALRREPLRETLRMVFFAALRRGASDRIVEHFESLKDRYPELTLSFEQMLQVGDAYVALGEHERASDVFRGIAEASFLREMGVAGTLEEQGRFLEAVAFVQRLLREYPSLPAVESASARLPQWLQARVGTAVLGSDGKPLSARELLSRAVELARLHLVAAPQGALSDEVAFGLVSALLAREEYPQVHERSALFASLFAGSRYLDDFLYAQGYADFALGRPEQALGVLQRVATEEFPDGRGASALGSHRELALWMRAQIHHAAGRLKEAIGGYTTVREKFTDAAQAIAQLERTELSLPEVTRIAPDAPARLEIRSRNLERLELQVFPVDLVRLYVLQRSLDDMTRVELAGIQPLLRSSLAVEAPVAYVERKTTAELALPELGAYLVVVRSGERSAAGMLIRTALELDVWSEEEHGLVRVAVRDEKGEPARKVHVKVVGSDGGAIQGADTDLRGIAAFEGIAGRGTLIAQSGPQVAFWRAPQQAARPKAENKGQMQGQQRFQEEATRGFFDANRVLNVQGGQELEQLLRSKQSGVEVYRARK